MTDTEKIMERLYAMEKTAIVTGRWGKYHGPIVPNVLYELLEEAILHGRLSALDEVEKELAKEIAIAHTEGTPTARLTSLYVSISRIRSETIG